MNLFVGKIKDMKESRWTVILNSASVGDSDEDSESAESDDVAGDLSMISNHRAVLYIPGSPQKI
jgi:hypothetical protein